MSEVPTKTSSDSKALAAILIIAASIPLLYYFFKKRQEPNSINRQFNKTIEDDNPITGKSRVLVNNFVRRLAQDEVLSKYFNPKTLLPHSLYAVVLERYMLVAMGQPFVQIPIDLRQKHKYMGITKEHFERFKKLWKECQKELGLEGKDIWDDFEDEIVTRK